MSIVQPLPPNRPRDPYTKRVWFKVGPDGMTAVGIIRGTWYRSEPYSLYRDPCVYCYGKSTTIEHIIPRSCNGGKGGVYNHAAACKKCNNDRSSTPLLVWLLKRWKHLRRP